MKNTFIVTYEKNEVYQAILVETFSAPSAEDTVKMRKKVTWATAKPVNDIEKDDYIRRGMSIIEAPAPAPAPKKPVPTPENPVQVLSVQDIDPRVKHAKNACCTVVYRDPSGVRRAALYANRRNFYFRSYVFGRVNIDDYGVVTGSSDIRKINRYVSNNSLFHDMELETESDLKPIEPVPVPVVSISHGNRKMGDIPSVSLPPVLSCAPGVPCKHDCYACKLCKIYQSVRESYMNNWCILRDYSALYWQQVRAAVSVSRFFRFHVSGDIPYFDYFSEMVKTAEMFPHCRILAFTKRYSIVNDYIRLHETPEKPGHACLPENLSIVFSEWPELPMENPYNLPVSRVNFPVKVKGKNVFPDVSAGVYKCPGNCTACAMAGKGCFFMDCNDVVSFDKH